MRLWPTTPLLSRETLVELSWRGARVPAGTQILIVNTFHHRDRERLDVRRPLRARGVDRRRRGATTGRFNHFSHGPQGCPGADLALLDRHRGARELLRRARA